MDGAARAGGRHGADVDVTPEPGERILRYFAFGHLPEGQLRDTSQLFGQLAEDVVRHVPAGPERTVALRKLLEAKDAAVRACLPDVEPRERT